LEIKVGGKVQYDVISAYCYHVPVSGFFLHMLANLSI
jgi:hypothetical protein